MADVNTKILTLKALLGDKAAQSALDEATKKSQAAKAAGVDFKEQKPATTTKAKDNKPTALSSLLDQIEAGLADGTIVNDVEESETEPTPAVDQKEIEAQKIALKEMIGEVFDEKFAQLLETAQANKTETAAKEQDEKAKAAEKQTALEAKLKEAQVQVAAFQKDLAELKGEQPKSAGFRASQAESTVTKETPKGAPTAGAFNDFISDFVMAGAAQQNQP